MLGLSLHLLLKIRFRGVLSFVAQLWILLSQGFSFSFSFVSEMCLFGLHKYLNSQQMALCSKVDSGRHRGGQGPRRRCRGVFMEFGYIRKFPVPGWQAAAAGAQPQPAPNGSRLGKEVTFPWAEHGVGSSASSSGLGEASRPVQCSRKNSNPMHMGIDVNVGCGCLVFLHHLIRSSTSASLVHSSPLQ